jgi:uncharacterized protein DUF262/uncharacterized protein DUF1524
VTVPPGLMTVSDLFGADRIFRIPPYQRPYAWGEQQVKDLLEDLRYTEKQRAHFFGTILLKDSRESRESLDVVDVVDGQQRLTTLQILIHECLRISSLESAVNTRLVEQYLKVDDVPRLTPSSFDDHFYQDVILGDQQYPTASNTPSQERLLRAKEQMRDYFGSLGHEEVTKFLDQVKRMKVLVYTVETDGEAAIIFETNNDRGMPLGTLDKTKSFLMQQLYNKAEHSEELLKWINDQFSTIYTMLDTLEGNAVASFDDTEIQKYHFILKEENWGSHKDYDDFLPYIKRALNEIARKPNSGEAVKNYVTEYTRSLVAVFTAVKELIESAGGRTDPRGSVLADFFSLRRTSAFMPLLVAGWIQSNRENTPKSAAEFSRLTKACEACSFRVYGIGGRRSNTGESDLYSRAWYNFRGQTSLDEAAALVWKMARDLTPLTTFKEKLGSSSFRGQTPDRDVKYVLWKYEDFIRRQSQPVEPLSVPASEIFSDKVEIEHILPQTNDLAIDQSDMIVNCLGNLALASKSANASMSNRAFADKLKGYYQNSSFRMQRELASRTQWGEQEIKDRTNILVNFCLSQWDAPDPQPPSKVGDRVTPLSIEGLENPASKEDEDKDGSPEVVDRSKWEGWTSKEVMELVDELHNSLKTLVPESNLRYAKSYVSLKIGEKTNWFVVFHPRKDFVEVEALSVAPAESVNKLRESGFTKVRTFRDNRIKFGVTSESFEKSKPLLEELFKEAHELSKNEYRNGLWRTDR